MANCSLCGRQLPPFSFGKDRDLCQWCRAHQAARAADEAGTPERDQQEQYQPVIRQPWRVTPREPLVTYGLFGINAAVFVAMALAGVSLTGGNTGQLLHWGANFGPFTLGGQWWRLVTCMFLHIGIIHIAFNMWCLLDLGKLAETLYGRWTFAGVYLLTGIAASVTSLGWQPIRVSAGASGAIFGIAGALFASLKLGEFSISRAQIQALSRSVITFIIYNVVFGAVMQATDNAAHIGGLVAGLIVGALIAKLAPGPDFGRRVVVIGAMAIAVAGAYIGVRDFRAPAVTVERAADLIGAHKYDDAIAELKRVLARRPDDVHAHFMLGEAYGEKGMYAESEREWKYLVQRDPKNAAAWYNLGWIYTKMDRLGDAKDAYAQAVKAAPQDAEFRRGLGRILAEQGDFPAAITELQQAAALDPKLGRVQAAIGYCYLQTGKYAEAATALRKAIDTDGDSEALEYNLALAYRGAGQLKEAEAARARAEQLKTTEQKQDQSGVADSH